MELSAISKTKTKMVFEVRGEDHTFCNLLREELWNEKNVTTSGYNIKHPLVGIPKFIVETSTGDVTAALESSAKSIKKKANDFKKAFAKL
ncbi:MAG: RpoL/Rpb11 RNA polymerase subunit family protein [Nanoarchaeota archaeon]